MMRLSELAGIVGGELRGEDSDFGTVSINTRALNPGDLYFALRGERFDGNDFVAEAVHAGASAAVVERFSDADLPQVQVGDGRVALGLMGAAWRARWAGKLVGITGSNGKTTVKEMVAAVLGEESTVLKTRGNLNNDIGVPLTLLRLSPEHRYGVVEMGANHPGEIAYVAGLVKPDVAIISNAGAAHLEGFGSVDGVARAKGELLGALEADGVAVLNADDAFFGYWRELSEGRRVLSFGFSESASVRADAASVRVVWHEGGFRTVFDLIHQGQRHGVPLALAGRHNVMNALAAAAAGLVLGVDPERIQRGLAALVPVPGRLEPVNGRKGTLLINDAYNANPSSFGAAIDVLVELPGEPWVVLGAFGELGESSPALHADIGREARTKGVRRLFSVGPNADRVAEAFGEGGCHCRDQEEMVERILAELKAGVAILVKGSRSQRMEQVVEALRVQEAACS